MVFGAGLTSVCHCSSHTVERIHKPWDYPSSLVRHQLIKTICKPVGQICMNVFLSLFFLSHTPPANGWILDPSHRLSQHSIAKISVVYSTGLYVLPHPTLQSELPQLWINSDYWGGGGVFKIVLAVLRAILSQTSFRISLLISLNKTVSSLLFWLFRCMLFRLKMWRFCCLSLLWVSSQIT